MTGGQGGTQTDLEAAHGDALREGIVGVVDREPDHLAIRIHLQRLLGFSCELRIFMLFYRISFVILF